MQPTTKDFEFTATAGDIFVIFLWSILFGIISIFGAPLLMQKAGKIIASKVLVNGRSLTFNVEYGEAFVFVLVQTLLIMVTLGIYYFWFIPKSYRFMLAHTHFADAPAAAPLAPPSQIAATPPPAESNNPVQPIQ